MPKIALVDGIGIAILYADHDPPHFHAFKAGDLVVIAIESGEVIKGSLPRRDLRKVRKWADVRKSELMAQWKKARERQALDWLT